MPVDYRQEDEIVVITIDRPERRNAIDKESSVALGQGRRSSRISRRAAMLGRL